ncbi:MAG TPA: hypothetical protein VL402_12980 [Xanthobacteraceae bacterium]|jgi:hypothetical protein|nr:hypothetical protein [Xanthobacteraceae bacterium]
MSRLSSRLFRTAALSSAVAGLAAFATLAPITSAHALTMKECSAKYKAAQKDGSLNGMKWNDYRKAQCGANASAAATPATTTTAAKPAPTAKPAAPARTASAPASAPAAATNAVFPTAVSPKYSKESAGKARQKTCLDQYNANKAGNGNGGLKWIQKGGGYYSECNKRLKG